MSYYDRNTLYLYPIGLLQMHQISPSLAQVSFFSENIWCGGKSMSYMKVHPLSTIDD